MYRVCIHEYICIESVLLLLFDIYKNWANAKNYAQSLDGLEARLSMLVLFLFVVWLLIGNIKRNNKNAVFKTLPATVCGSYRGRHNTRKMLKSITSKKQHKQIVIEAIKNSSAWRGNAKHNRIRTHTSRQTHAHTQIVWLAIHYCSWISFSAAAFLFLYLFLFLCLFSVFLYLIRHLLWILLGFPSLWSFIYLLHSC